MSAEDSSATDGSATDGSATDGSATDGSATDGSATDGSTTDGSATDGSATDGSATTESPSFSVAMRELGSILERIDNDSIDIDQLATELRRAKKLIDLCRGKIRKTDIEVNQIVKQLEESSND